MKFAVVITFLIGSLVACRSTKEINKVIQPRDTTFIVVNQSYDDSVANAKDLIGSIRANHINFKTFSAKIKAEVEDKNGKHPDLSVVVRIQRDSAIWISVSATFLSVEVYRIFITPDSVILLNKQDKEVQYRSLDFLQEVTQIPFDFNTMQNLLVGNPVFFDTTNINIRSSEQYISVSYVGEFFKHLLTLDRISRVMLHSKLDDVDVMRNRTATISYGEHENIEGFTFPTFRHISIAEKNKLDMKLKYKQVEFNKELSLNFNIPKNYTRK